ncbi:ADAM family mig-17 isoform X2 [Biomphalaria glabrata]|nr:ADAM family mig-17 isoform X2 [Biomphalaria glabrata]
MKLNVCFVTLALMVLFYKCQAQVYVAEGYFVIDSSAVQNYIREINTSDSYAVKYQQAVDKIQKDVTYILTQVNNILTSVSKFGYNIEIRVRRLDILAENVVSSVVLGTSNVVDSYIAIDTFKNWLIERKLYGTLQFDFAVLWTGLDLLGSLGYSKHFDSVIGGICAGPAAVSVVEFQPTYRDVVGTAHAFALLLGTNTDGITSSYATAFMNLPNHSNRWAFSPCSGSDIKEYLAQLKPNCLVKTDSQSTKPSINFSTYNGDMLNPDIICQRSLNDSRSYMCKSLPEIYNYQPPRGNAVCSQIFCHVPSSPSQCTPVYSSDGLVCDSQRRCNAGGCNQDNAPYIDGNCVFGDQKTLDLPSVPFYGSCQSYIDQYGAVSCYYTPINQSCCATCKNYSTGIYGRLYINPEA